MKKKSIKANDIHEIVLNLPLQEYYDLFQIMFNNIMKFIKSTEGLADKYNQEFKIYDKNTYGYQPTGEKNGDNSIPPNCGTSVQNIKDERG